MKYICIKVGGGLVKQNRILTFYIQLYKLCSCGCAINNPMKRKKKDCLYLPWLSSPLCSPDPYAALTSARFFSSSLLCFPEITCSLGSYSAQTSVSRDCIGCLGPLLSCPCNLVLPGLTGRFCREAFHILLRSVTP